MARLLLVHHSPSPTVQRITDAVIAGAHDDSITGVEVVVSPALGTTAEDVLAADGYLLGTTANFGYMSGALKHFFDTTYNRCLEHTQGRPYGLYVHGRTDTTGAIRSVQSIVGGLSWRQVADVLSIVGEVTDEHEEQAYELGGTLAAVLADLSP